MATNESEFKSEIKSSFERASNGPVKVWSPTDKLRAGVSDLHIVHTRFYAIELKWITKMPARDASNLLTREFTPKQLLFLREVNSCVGGVGLGIVGLTPNDAIIVEPDDLSDGNLSRSKAEYLYAKVANHLTKEKGLWNIEKVLEYRKKDKAKVVGL